MKLDVELGRTDSEPVMAIMTVANLVRTSMRV